MVQRERSERIDCVELKVRVDSCHSWFLWLTPFHVSRFYGFAVSEFECLTFVSTISNNLKQYQTTSNHLKQS